MANLLRKFQKAFSESRKDDVPVSILFSEDELREIIPLIEREKESRAPDLRDLVE